MSAGGRYGSTEKLIADMLDAHRSAGTRPTPHRITPGTDLDNMALEIVERVQVERAAQLRGYGRAFRRLVSPPPLLPASTYPNQLEGLKT